MKNTIVKDIYSLLEQVSKKELRKNKKLKNKTKNLIKVIKKLQGEGNE